jgi:hypothetical protein
VKVGGTVAFSDASHHLALRITTGKPSTAQHALSGYAHGPANGEYLIISVQIKNLSPAGYTVDPSHFEFTTTSGRKLTVDSGNAPFSGASHVLDPTFLVLGAAESGPLIYDTPQSHGHIVLKQSGMTACTWTV